MQALAIAPSGHLTASELVHDDDFAIFDDVVFVALKDDLGFNGVLHVARQVKIVFIVDVFNARQLLKFIDTGLGQNDGTCLFLDGIVRFKLQTWRPASKLAVHIRGFLSLARNDQRSTCLVDKDVINFVDDGIV